jgi:beta-phosphoglucomutase-like phosphatase (HAD superfamily)
MKGPWLALIFDFDGVLADTEGLHCAAFQAVAAEIGITLKEKDYYEKYLGLLDADCFKTLLRDASVELDEGSLADLVSRKGRAFAALSQSARLYPGAVETLQQLHRKFLLAIASGAFRGEIEPILEREGVRDLFCAIVGADDIERGKPAPDSFLRVMDLINQAPTTAVSGSVRPLDRPVRAQNCVVIEDSPRGIAAAHAAGMCCIAVATGHDRAALAEADLIIDEIGALLRLKELELEGKTV